MENRNNNALSYLVHSTVFKSARPASEQIPSNERRDRLSGTLRQIWAKMVLDQGRTQDFF